MKLSIIVPVYNVLPYIRQCLDSLLGQTMENYEIILIDDGSTDGTAQVLADYAARFPEKIVLRRVENGGQGRARNIAIDMAKGEYLGFIDSDDWIDPTMYEKLCKRAEDTGADVVVCDWLIKHSDGRDQVFPARVQDHWLAAAGSACNKIFRRSLIGDTRFPAGLWYEDFYFSAMMLLKARGIEYRAEPLYMYRQSQSSTMRNNNAAKNLDMLTILDMLEEYMLPHGFKDEFAFFIINHVLIDSINRVYRQQTSDRDQVLDRLRDYVRSKLPDLAHCPSYLRESRNRRIIAALNYRGLYGVSALILQGKSRLAKK